MTTHIPLGLDTLKTDIHILQNTGIGKRKIRKNKMVYRTDRNKVTFGRELAVEVAVQDCKDFQAPRFKTVLRVLENGRTLR